MAGPLVRSIEAPQAARVTGASTGLETELFVACYTFLSIEFFILSIFMYFLSIPFLDRFRRWRKVFSFHMLRENCVLFAKERMFITLGIGGATVI